MVSKSMQSPAVQVALNNLVETIRTSLMAEFLELLRSGKPARAKPGRKSRQPTASKPTARRAAAKPVAKKAKRRAAASRAKR
jgi:hypothetical protein